MERTISTFFGEYRFLSNFWPCEITILGIPYKSVEAAYQASKCSSIHKRMEFSQLGPKEAKRLGRTLKLDRWDDMTKVTSMELCLRAKFGIPALQARLISTAPLELIEGNTWGDEFWGKCGDKGRNTLGKLLMILRDEYILYAPQYRICDPINNNDDEIPF